MLDVCLITAGVIVIVVSFILSDKADHKKPAEGSGNVVDIWTSKDEQSVKEHIDQVLTEKTENTVLDVEDQLSKISNEKIMAVSEYSDQVLEKISQNHKEVVFLYDMLNQKDREMKTSIQSIDAAKTKAEEAVWKIDEGIKKLNETMKVAQSLQTGVRKETAAERLSLERRGAAPARSAAAAQPSAALQTDTEMQGAAIDPAVTNQASKISKAAAKRQIPVREPEELRLMEERLKHMGMAKGISAIERLSENSTLSDENDNRKEQVLKLYEEGKSILEIAKSLGLGQGEVKLVVNLFKRDKKL